MYRNQHKESRKTKIQRNIFQTKEEDKTSEKNLSETEISNLPNKEFKLMMIAMFTKFGSRMNKLSENFNKEIEILKSIK